MDSGPFAMIAACTPSQLHQLKLKTETAKTAHQPVTLGGTTSERALQNPRKSWARNEFPEC